MKGKDLLVAILVVLLQAQLQAGTVTNTNDSGPGSLRQVIIDAAAGDTINFATSVTGTITLTSGELLISQNLTIQGPGAKVLAVSGNDSTRVFEIFAGTSTISGLTIRNGLSLGSGGNGQESEGGGIFIRGTLNLSACAVTNNKAVGNSAYGDLISFGGGIVNFGTATISHCTINGNSATGGNLLPNQAGSNNAGLGGGIASTGTLNITDTTVTNNRATGGDNPLSNGKGGAGDGGGIAFLDTAQGFSSTLSNCTISHNSAVGGQGSGGNGIGMGGGIDAQIANPTLDSTIVALNSAATRGPDINGTVSGSFNLIGDGSDEMGIANGTSSNQVGTTAAHIDPLLGPLQDNGGPTLTRALLAGSPALDKGTANGLTTDQRGFARTVNDPTISNTGDGSDVGAFEVQPSGPVSAQLLNISTRLRVQTGDNVLIGGFIITGTGPKKVVIRAIGPSLSQYFSGVLADPILDLYQGSTKIGSNDNWKDTQQADIEATGIPPKNDFESAILKTLDPGAYTAIVSGKSGGSGIGLVEAYDVDKAAATKLVNIATRGFVEQGDNVMIGGFIIGPDNGTGLKVLVRGIGPSLTAAGVPGALPDPFLDLKDANGMTLRSDNDWQDQQAAEIQATGLAPKDSKEAAILATLAPGSYTAILRGNGETPTGVGLVEVYYVP